MSWFFYLILLQQSILQSTHRLWEMDGFQQQTGEVVGTSKLASYHNRRGCELSLLTSVPITVQILRSTQSVANEVYWQQPHIEGATSSSASVFNKVDGKTQQSISIICTLPVWSQLSLQQLLREFRSIGTMYSFVPPGAAPNTPQQ